MKSFQYRPVMRCVYLSCSLGILCVGTLLAQTSESSLIERSPFLPPSAKNQATQPVPAPNQAFPNVDFVGYSGVDGDWEVALFFANSNQVHWMKPGDTIESVQLVDFDPAKSLVQLNNDRVTKSIRLNDTKPAAMDAAPALPQNMPQPGMIPSQPNVNNNNQNDDDDAARRRVIPRRRVILPRSSSSNTSSSIQQNNSQSSTRMVGQASTQSQSEGNTNSTNSGNGTANQLSLNSETIMRRQNAMIPRDRPVLPRN